ncbi:MAG: hypothetical protein NTZ43_13545 [Gemmatimonadetes bacterium]|nr:hypothetical protein [Gemmatimonadota bacterium]
MNRAVVLLLFAAACADSKNPSITPQTPAVSPSAITSTSSAVSPMATRVWDDALGALVATPAIDGTQTLAFVRDTAAGTEMVVDLFSHDERAATGTLRVGSPIGGCSWLRQTQLIHGPQADSPTVWSLALAPGTATALGITAVGDLAPKDSSALIVRINKLVSALPDDSTSAPFRGLPVTVRDAWQVQLPSGTTVIAAIATRALNVESNPRADVVTLLAESEGTAKSTASWRTVFTRRDAGPEETVSGADLLAALVLADGRPTFVFVRETDRGPHIEFVERLSQGDWRLRWTTHSLPCVR